MRVELTRARVEACALVAHVVETDGFGNLALDARLRDLKGTDIRLGDPIAVRRDTRRAPGVFARTFADVARGGLLLYEDAGGSLAVAINGGDAAALLGARPRRRAARGAGVTLGRPRLHLRSTGSTNERARELALAGAPHGTAVTAGEQTAGPRAPGARLVDAAGHARSRSRW